MRLFILWKKKLAFPAIGVGLACLVFAACNAMPSPLFGTWADNQGNTFSFFEDGTFTAIVKSNGFTLNYEGSYTVLRNALTLACTNVDKKVVTEWDIRGNILYLDWIDEDRTPVSMTLYKISN